jgi:DNA-3-methyladenine glycosylase II
VNLIAEEAHTLLPKPAAVTRLADPSRTNALLHSPRTSRIIASAPVEPLPSKLRDSIQPTGPPPTATTTATTTANILEEACAHLIKVDPRMKPLIDKHHCRIFSPEGLAEQIDPFEALCSSIISQQVSGAAAKSIKARFIALFDEENTAATATEVSTPTPTFPSPAAVAATPLETLRTAGLSQRKAEYLQGLAEKFVSGELTAQMLADAPYEEVLEKLTAVRGLGRWSVEMFACFALKRMDVFSTGDLGVQRGMAAFVGRDVAKLKAKGGGKWKYMAEKEMEEISERFRPFRSVFMWYMWRVEETDVSTME